MPFALRAAPAALVIAFVFVPGTDNGSRASEPAASFAPALGDTDCTGEVDAADLMGTLRLGAGLPPLPGCAAAADVNCDGAHDALDALDTARHLAGLPRTGAPSGCGAIGTLYACGSANVPVAGTYIALGDSLSEGIGATSRDETAFVPLVHDCIGTGFELLNMGESGDTSGQLLSHGHIADAVREVETRNSDEDPDNDVKVVTLEIGGNDLLDLFFDLVLGGTCPNVEVALQKPAECVEPLHDALDRYRYNLRVALDRLTAADPGVPVVMFTLYDPFSGTIAPFSELAVLALEGEPGTAVPAGLNDVMREVAPGYGVLLTDVYPLFTGRARYLVSGDYIHPNDAGYRVIAKAVSRALGLQP
jgi:lysophospholipase L1-like esterase